MAVDNIRLIVLTTVSQILSSYAQYVQYAGAAYPIPAYVSSYPIQSIASNPSVYAQPSTNIQPYQIPSKPAGTPASYAQTGPSYAPANPSSTGTSTVYQPTVYQVAPHQQPAKAAAVTIPPESPKVTKAVQIPKEASIPNPLPRDLPSSAPFDTNILNNLAIALQLLIISNLIHNPPQGSTSASQILEDVFPEIAPLPIPYVPPSIPDASYLKQYPNADFLVTSSFGDTGISKAMMAPFGSPTIPSPRPMGFMSPYDAIGPNSPYKDYFQAPELKSSYHLVSDYKDPFSLTELFKI